MPPNSAPPPGMYALAGDPVRWALLCQLSYSDRRVGELCELLGRPQNLVSYHLGKLRAQGIVTRRRSAADGRDCYYTIDFLLYGRLVAESAEALHPALRLRPDPRGSVSVAAGASAGRSRASSARVLFLCTGNSARSQMAQAFAESYGAETIEAFSAGSRPKPLHPQAVRAMGAYGIDLSGRPSTDLRQLQHQRFDWVVTLCDRVREICPEFPGAVHQIHWSIPDPAAAADADEDTYSAFARVAEQVSLRVQYLLALAQSSQEVI